MPEKVIKPLVSWSFSRYSDYALCPARFKYKHLLKLTEPTSGPLLRGQEIHDEAAAYIRGERETLHDNLLSYAIEFDILRDMYARRGSSVVVEDTWAFTKTWDVTSYDDWSGCWLRVKLDLGYTTNDGEDAVIIDWKSGQLRKELHEEYMLQLDLYALAAFLQLPSTNRVATWLGYVDLGVTYPELDKPKIYTRKDVTRLKREWEGRVRPMFNDKQFAPRPNSKCKWCHYRKGNNGPCEY